MDLERTREAYDVFENVQKCVEFDNMRVSDSEDGKQCTCGESSQQPTSSDSVELLFDAMKNDNWHEAIEILSRTTFSF